MIIFGSRSFTKSWLIWDVVLLCFCIFFPDMTQLGECHSVGCADPKAIICGKPDITGHTPIQPSLNKPEGGCPRKWKLFNNKCYLLHTEKKYHKSWELARESCKEKGGDLVSITNVDEQMFLLSQVEHVDLKPWIGLNDLNEEGNFEWSDGTPVNYTHWDDRRPSPSPQYATYESDCVSMMNYGTIGFWRDEICSQKRGYVCQKATDPTIAVTNPPPVTELALFGKSLFWVDMISQPFAEARKVCQRNGSEIASLISVYEQAFVSLLARRAGGELWIGVKRNETSGAYHWLDGLQTNVTTGWAENEPAQAQACVRLVAGEGLMTESCSKNLPVLCKKSPDPPPADTRVLGPCPSTNGNWEKLGDSCFLFQSDTKLSWMGAAVACSELDGSLTSLKNRTESRLLEEKMKFFRNVTEGFWIGLHVDSDGCLSWLDGSSTSYNRLWASNKQECSTYSSGACERCVEISSKDFSWKERDCTDRTGFICRASRKVIGTAGVIENGRKAAKVVLPAHIHGKRRSAGCEVRKIFHKPKIALTPNQPSLDEPQGGCPWKWDLFNNKCYLSVTERPDRKSWKNAWDSCKDQGGDLVSIANVDEQMFLLTLLPQKHMSWIGLNDLNEEGNFVWSDGTPVNYTRWDYGRPYISQQHGDFERHCVALMSDESIIHWHDELCDFKRGYVCKQTTDPTIAPTKPAPLTELVPFGKSMFQVDPTPRSFAEARAACRRNGSDIASVISVYEHAFVSLLARRAGGALWIGLNAYETAGAYRWLDDWYMPMTGWATDEPAQHQACVRLVAGEGWMTESCSKPLPVVCKKSPEPTPTDAPARGPCPSESSLGYWQVLSDSCFLFQSDTKLSWMGAAATCSRLGGSLASLKSKFENEVVERYTSFSKKKAKTFWIGLHRSFNGKYSWLDGSPMRYDPRWESNRQSSSDDPSGTNERCVALTIDSKGFSWNDHSCTHRAGYICRAPKG